MKPTVLVTGANGFVGRNLCPELQAQGWQVRAAVRRRGQAPQACQECLVADLGPETDWQAAVSGCDTVVHLSARVHVMQETAADPMAEFRRANVEGSLALAQAAIAAGVKRLVFVSTVKVHGEGAGSHAYTEQDVPLPEDPYGLSKWEAEQALTTLAQHSGLELVILRPPLVYGPGVGANFRRLMHISAKGLPLPLAAIRNRRSLLFVGNLCHAIGHCLRHPAAVGATYLVSDDEVVSTPELFRRMARQAGAPDRLWPLPPLVLRLLGLLTGKSAEIFRLTESLEIDSSLIRRQLGWQAPFSMDQGLAVTRHPGPQAATSQTP